MADSGLVSFFLNALAVVATAVCWLAAAAAVIRVVGQHFAFATATVAVAIAIAIAVAVTVTVAAAADDVYFVCAEVVFPYLGLQQRAEALIKDSQMNMYVCPQMNMFTLAENFAFCTCMS